VLTPSDFIVP